MRPALTVLAALILSVFLLAPFAWLVLASFKTDVELLAVPPVWLPEHFTLDNYLFFLSPSGRGALAAGNAGQALPRALLNSALIATLVAVTNLALAVPAAYAFVRLRFRGATVLLLLYLATRMVPAVAIMIPIYVFFAQAQLLDTIFAPALAHVTLTLPFSIWIVMSYLQTIPQELEDAARVDRCTRLQAVTKIMLPVAAPGLLAAAMFAFMTSWGEFLLSAILTRTIASTPANIVISNLATDPYLPRTLIAAGAVISIAVPVGLALMFQRVIVQGLVAGSVKG